MSEWLNIFRKCCELEPTSTYCDKRDKTDKSTHAMLQKDSFGSFDSFVTSTSTNNCLSYLELFEERAAILEYDGGMPKPEAERLAYQMVLSKFITHCYPKIAEEFSLRTSSELQDNNLVLKERRYG